MMEQGGPNRARRRLVLDLLLWARVFSQHKRLLTGNV